MRNEKDQITDNIWLGDITAANDITSLKALNINKVLSVTDNRIPHYKKEDNINHRIIKVADFSTSNIIKHFGECLRFMKGEENILVHCIAGSSRSASVVIAYIMWNKKLPYQEAFNFLSQKRSSVLPNDGFVKQLKIFEKLLKDNEYDIDQINFYSIKINE